jgi:hypothetical protein
MSKPIRTVGRRDDDDMRRLPIRVPADLYDEVASEARADQRSISLIAERAIRAGLPILRQRREAAVATADVA